MLTAGLLLMLHTSVVHTFTYSHSHPHPYPIHVHHRWCRQFCAKNAGAIVLRIRLLGAPNVHLAYTRHCILTHCTRPLLLTAWTADAAQSSTALATTRNCSSAASPPCVYSLVYMRATSSFQHLHARPSSAAYHYSHRLLTIILNHALLATPTNPPAVSLCL